MKLLNMIKTGRIYAYMSDLRRYPNMLSFKKRYKSLGESAVILLGTPAHKNLGDHLIAVSELKFIEDCYPNHLLFEIPTHVFIRYESYIRKYAKRYTHVFITGGGWMGSMWPEEERTLQSMLNAFKESPLVILPQTVYYDVNSKESVELHESANGTFGKCNDLKLCVRDQQSLDCAFTFQALSKDKVLLCPDIALYYPDKYPYGVSGSRKIGVYLRKDREKMSSDNVLNVIMNYFKKEEYDSFISDTMAEHLVPINKREGEIRRIIEDMRQCRIILTDRLHAMIYSVIAGIPCIVLDNKTHKVQGVYSKWLITNKNILFIGEDGCSESDIEEFSRKASSPFELDYLDEEFKMLKQFINGN